LCSNFLWLCYLVFYPKEVPFRFPLFPLPFREMCFSWPVQGRAFGRYGPRCPPTSSKIPSLLSLSQNTNSLSTPRALIRNPLFSVSVYLPPSFSCLNLSCFSPIFPFQPTLPPLPRSKVGISNTTSFQIRFLSAFVLSFRSHSRRLVYFPELIFLSYPVFEAVLPRVRRFEAGCNYFK